MQQGKFQTKPDHKRKSPRKILLRILAGLVAVLLCVGIALYVIPLTETVSDHITEHAGDWMSLLDDGLALNEIVIPGTHDSATQYVQLAFFSKCQALSIQQQLEAGFRYLDIRVGLKDNRLALVYGFTKCKTGPMPWSQTLYLDSVLQQCYAFLEEHPSETVIFAVKAEQDNLVPAQLEQMLLEDYISEQPDRWLLTEELPALGQARGKLVLMRRYEDEAGLKEQAGIPMIWGDQGGSTEELLSTEMTDNGSYRLWVQDRYEYGNDQKWEAFLAGIGEEAIRSTDLSINFLSTKGTLPYGHPYSHATVLNYRLLDSHSGWLKGWIIIDFGSSFLAEQIYNTNFEK